MEKYRGAAISIGILTGFVIFAITVFIIPPKRALLLGLLGSTLFIFAIGLITDLNHRKYKNVDKIIKQKVLLKNTANYYKGTFLCYGVLFLTKDRLIFISLKRKTIYREEIPIKSIKRATYGKVFKNTPGLKLIMHDSSTCGFVLRDVEYFLDFIYGAPIPGFFEEKENNPANGV